MVGRVGLSRRRIRKAALQLAGGSASILLALWLSAASACAVSIANRPADENGLISNVYFGLYADGTHPTTTTKGLNAALAWAGENGIRYLKLAPGEYALDGSHKNGGFMSNSGVHFPSALTLDLNGATLLQTATSSPAYSMLCLYDVENVVIENGTLAGDRDKHDYSEDTDYATHEFGFGIDIRGSRGVRLSNLNIYGMTGDAILLSGNDKTVAGGGAVCRDITIANCKLYDCRRQGISIVGAQTVSITGTSIFGIEGTAPQGGIDMENELDWPVSQVAITNCNIINKQAVIFQRGSYACRVESSYIQGFVGFVEGSSNSVIDCDIVDGGIVGQDTPKVRFALVQDNRLTGADILFKDSRDTIISGNVLENGQIDFNASSGAVCHNEVRQNGESKHYAMRVTGCVGKEPVDIYWAQNQTEGIFAVPVVWNYDSGFRVIGDEKACRAYMEKVLSERQSVTVGEDIIMPTVAATIVSNLAGDHIVKRNNGPQTGAIYAVWLLSSGGVIMLILLAARHNGMKAKRRMNRRRNQKADTRRVWHIENQ